MRVRAATEADEKPIVDIFWRTLALGRPMTGRHHILDAYVELCLRWYLDPGLGGAAVAVTDEGSVCGYALVCVDERAWRRWATPRALWWTARAAAGSLSPSCPRPVAQFVRLRVRDGWRAARGRVAPPFPAHAHLNCLPHARGAAGRLLVSHIDDTCRRAGLSGWYGEINAPAGRRAAVLERYGARVLHRADNLTLTWLTGSPVERLTVARVLPPRGQLMAGPLVRAS